MLKLRPPNGWQAVGWELAIVTLGVLLALAAQQWAEERSWRAKARDATAALKEEIGAHYAWSVEWRVVAPCIIAQIDRLQKRVMASGERLDPAPVHSEPGFRDFVVRIPSKEYDDTVWDATIGDGVSSHLDPALRRELSAHYAQVRFMIDLTARNNVDYQRILSLSRPMPLDPSVRFSLLERLDEMRGRAVFMDLLSGQMIDHVVKVGMTLPPSVAGDAVRKYGTYGFCRRQGFPTRSLAAASVPVPN